MGYGFVYVAHNHTFPGLFKIGCTHGSPSARVSQLSAATGVPTPFGLIAYAEVLQFQAYERNLHAKFSGYRNSPKREFFGLPLPAFELLLSILEEDGASYYVCPWEDHMARTHLENFSG